ncbi:glycosyltransferase family 4 protein [Streptomyces olivaceiscleroticus]|uniref:Glycosyltransferase family 4 protein n=1 Tax=Streptomyces olivaceiscleroticus TaxID=68245 RepID=A0ABP3KAF2_9ACTN
MSSTPAPPPAPSLRTVQVLGRGSAGSAAHVHALSAGLVARGVRVTVCAASDAEDTYGFTGVGARFERIPPRTDPGSIAALRAACADADVVHAHGLHAGLRASLALRGRRVPLVVTWHTKVHSEGARAQVTRLLERRVARAAAVVLGSCVELVGRARERGARDARLAPPAGPRPRTDEEYAQELGRREKRRAELGALGRPLLLTVGRLDAHQGHDMLLDAAHGWCGRDPQPLVAVAGEGPLRPALQQRIDAEGLPVLLLGRREDVPGLLAAADLVLATARWEARSVLAQEALRAGVPLVATDVGGTRELVGRAAELVPYGDASLLSRTVVELLDEPARQSALTDAGRAQAAGWPTEDDTVAQVLSVYDELQQARD